MHYRKRVLKRVIASIETETTSVCVIKQMSILDATAASAWDDVSQQIIINCFRHAGFKSNAAEPASDEQPEFELHEEIGQLMSQLPDQDPTAF
ncbi:hypothetical protein PoB_004902700 [Plakobranchus ocellatus]|uniref:DDE-1 domain-containing protein n=1 Tax=Plakobranchus ocellatus TaxID=259542 RepID=A0AAV4BSY4_9GAST|nr:hypothetical protein PoB_004902700 [Plakobranchus ocellatus]